MAGVIEEIVFMLLSCSTVVLYRDIPRFRRVVASTNRRCSMYVYFSGDFVWLGD